MALSDKFKDLLSISAIAFVCSWIVFQSCTRDSSVSNFPSQPINIICPTSPGGGSDLISRTIANDISLHLKSTVNVSNIPGGASSLGHMQAKIASNDGYTMAMIVFEILPGELQKIAPVGYKDFDFIAKVNEDPACVAVRSDSNIKNLAELLADAKNGKIFRIGNSGVGSVWHLAAESFSEKSGIKTIGVPFDGASNAITALIGGHVDIVTVSVPELKGHIDSGKVRVLAVMNNERLKHFPNIPTCKEEGIDIVFSTWRAFALPKRCDPKVRKILESSIERAVAGKGIKELSENMGMNFEYKKGSEFESELELRSKNIQEIMKKLKLIK